MKLCEIAVKYPKKYKIIKDAFYKYSKAPGVFVKWTHIEFGVMYNHFLWLFKETNSDRDGFILDALNKVKSDRILK